MTGLFIAGLRGGDPVAPESEDEGAAPMADAIRAKVSLERRLAIGSRGYEVARNRCSEKLTRLHSAAARSRRVPSERSLHAGADTRVGGKHREPI
jgi:hypothetical protein